MKITPLDDDQKKAITAILQERNRQQAKWGEQNHDMPTWLAILHEETGELAKATLHLKFGGPQALGVFEEAVQVAAISLQIIEFLYRAKYHGTTQN